METKPNLKFIVAVSDIKHTANIKWCLGNRNQFTDEVLYVCWVEQNWKDLQ